MLEYKLARLALLSTFIVLTLDSVASFVFTPYIVYVSLQTIVMSYL